MKIILILLRILFAILLGLAGCIAPLNAPYQMLNANFRFADGGPFVLLSVILGSHGLWSAWRLLRVLVAQASRPRVPTTG